MPCDDRSENVVRKYQTILGELQATIESVNFDQIVCDNVPGILMLIQAGEDSGITCYIL